MRLPEGRLWHDAVAQLKVEQMRRRSRDGATGGVVFAGSSQPLDGIAPEHAAPGFGLRAYNAALHRGFLPLTELWLLDVVVPILRPRFVVLGLGPLDLTDNGRAQYDVVQRFESSVARRRGSVAAAARALHQRSAVARHALAAARLLPSMPTDELRIGPDGEGREFAAATEYRLSEKKRLFVATEMLADYRAGPRTVGSLRRIATGLLDDSIGLVLVRMPHTPELDEMIADGAQLFAAADEQVGKQASDLGVRFVDAPADVRDHEWFADCIHLNGRGMRVVSETIAGAIAAELEEIR